jgi:uncharacterized protein YndB with AHSA1/START domain
MRDPNHIVHRAFADAATRHCPWARGEMPQVGGIFTTRMEARDGSFGFDMTWQYTAVDPLKSVSYTMGEMKEYFLDAGRVVDVLFQEDGSCGCVTVTETFDAEEIHDLEMQKAGRQAILENFKKHVESCEG